MIEDNITIKINKSNINHFKKLGYDINLNDFIQCNVKDINKGSHLEVNVKCDNCLCNKTMMFKTYHKLTNNLIDKYLCKKCSYLKNKETNLKKYGFEHPMKNKNIIEKLLKTNNDRYGTNSASQLNEYKEKQRKTNLEKYEYISPLQNQKIINKTKKTNLEKYGFEHHSKNDKIKNKIKYTKKIKYNDSNYNNRDKYIQTSIIKYGYKNPTMCEEIKNKINKTKSINLIKKYPNIISVDNNNLMMLCDNNQKHIFEIDKSVFQNRKKINTVICTICNNGVKSGNEILFYNYIKENYKNILYSDRKILYGKELDIYLPDLKLAFEFNGLYWHNELNKEKNYHKTKTDLCLEKEIQLIHIYEDDWNNKQDIIKSMILNKLGKTPNKIYARKTEIKEILDNKLVRNFLDKNHIQGHINSSVKIGLFYDNELISLMTFGRLRKSMNSKSNNEEYEMLRFCSKLNTNVIGGASKLFKYFLNNYNSNQIVSYADRSYSNGNLYKQLGFELEHITEPIYYYIINGMKNNRFKFRKDILVKQGFVPNKSEHEIMLERKIYRIYNSGNLKFIFK